jgi:hypothetical protein
MRSATVDCVAPAFQIRRRGINNGAALASVVWAGADANVDAGCAAASAATCRADADVAAGCAGGGIGGGGGGGRRIGASHHTPPGGGFGGIAERYHMPTLNRRVRPHTPEPKCRYTRTVNTINTTIIHIYTCD